MRIPIKFYNEDQAAKAVKIKETEEQMKPDVDRSQYGGGLTAE
jgi:hypothetical protein